MNHTAVLHAIGTVLLGVGILVSGQIATVGAFGIAVVCFLVGIILARIGDTGQRPDSPG